MKSNLSRKCHSFYKEQREMVSKVLQSFRKHPARSINRISPLLASLYRVLDAHGLLSDFIADPVTSLFRPVFHFMPSAMQPVSHGPVVSIVVATRNNAATIERSLNSLLRQTYLTLEIIVIDDFSEDGSLETLKRLAESDERLVVVSNSQHVGTGESRNIGLRMASGKYVTFHDGDDFSEPHRIAAQVEALERSGKLLCLCNYVRVNNRGHSMQINDNRVMKCIISMMFLRAPVRDAVGYFVRESLSEDADFYERIKIAFGSESEVVLTRLLYRALYRRGSSFFSSVSVLEDTNHSVRYIKSENSVATYELLKIRHEEMRAGRMSVRVD